MAKRVATLGIVVSCLLLQPVAYAGSSDIRALIGLGKWAVEVFSPALIPGITAWLAKQGDKNIQPQSNSQKFQWHVSWQGPDGPYSGIVWMNGTSGHAMITPPGGVAVYQDIQAMPLQDTIILNGSSPRDSTGRPYPNYVPDRFRLMMTPAGFGMADTCDYANRCARIFVNYASPYN
jgi:hypothetical protein